MKSERSEYPKRPQFFAHKFCRLVARACVANDHGADAAYLLTVIAGTEDAKGYRGPVTYFNEQLMPIIGKNTHHSLIRVRDRAVESGWLHYEPGGKGVPGKYWVVVPDRYSNLKDKAFDENPADYRVAMTETTGEAINYHDENGSGGSVSTLTGGRRSGEEASQEAERKRRGTVNHSSYTKKPIPSPREDSPEPPKPAASVPTADEAPILVFPTVGKGREWSLVPSQLSKWRQAYPALDILAECRKALAWCEANPARRKTPKGMCAFLVNWLNRATNDGKSARASSGYRSRAQLQDDYFAEQLASIAPEGQP